MRERMIECALMYEMTFDDKILPLLMVDYMKVLMSSSIAPMRQLFLGIPPAFYPYMDDVSYNLLNAMLYALFDVEYVRVPYTILDHDFLTHLDNAYANDRTEIKFHWIWIK